jgi:hypothetical protein
MFGSVVLEIVIAISFIYFILSLVVTVVNEFIASLFSLRAATLRNWIRTLLVDDDAVEKFYDHPLLKSIHQDFFFWSRKPSYIPSKSFATALIDQFAPQKEQELARAALKEDKTPPDRDVRTLPLAAIEYVIKKNSKTRKATAEELMLLLIAEAKQDVAYLESDALKEIVQTLADVGKLAETDESMMEFATKLKTYIDEAETGLLALQERIEEWFNGTMESMKGWYKQRMQIVGLLVAAVISIGANADTLTIANTVSTNSALRQQIVEAAESLVEKAEAEGAETTEELVNTLEESTEGLELPLGWSEEELVRVFPNRVEDASDIIAESEINPKLWWFRKIVGLLITTVALSLGAPFWFDMLNKLVNLKWTGKSPDDK